MIAALFDWSVCAVIRRPCFGSTVDDSGPGHFLSQALNVFLRSWELPLGNQKAEPIPPCIALASGRDEWSGGA